MTGEYKINGEEIEFVFDLADKAMALLATENPAAVKLAEAYLSICHDALLVRIVAEG